MSKAEVTFFRKLSVREIRFHKPGTFYKYLLRLQTFIKLYETNQNISTVVCWSIL